MSAPRRNVAFNKPADPSFLKAFKQRVGYKNPDTIEAKRTRQFDSREPEDREDQEDEKPTVVVLKPGDLTKEEAEKAMNKQKGSLFVLTMSRYEYTVYREFIARRNICESSKFAVRRNICDF